VDADKLAEFYAAGRHRYESAMREFEQRSHDWRITLSPEADAWAEAVADGPDAARLTGSAHALVEAADDAGLFLKPEPGWVRGMFSSRDPLTEKTDGVGFGFRPRDAEHLALLGSAAVPFGRLVPVAGRSAAAIAESLRLVCSTFASLRPVDGESFSRRPA
jgi:hypothetical protein